MQLNLTGVNLRKNHPGRGNLTKEKKEMKTIIIKHIEFVEYSSDACRLFTTSGSRIQITGDPVEIIKFTEDLNTAITGEHITIDIPAGGIKSTYWLGGY
jgi:hypothetical protein